MTPKSTLLDIFPNTDVNAVEYIFSKDATGRVVADVTRFKVRRDQIEVLVTGLGHIWWKGFVIDKELRLKAKAYVPEDESTIE